MVLILPPSIGADEGPVPQFTVAIPDSAYPEYTLSRGLLKEACRRRSINLKIISLPVSRSIWEVDRGTYDCDGPRNRTVEKNYSNLRRIPEVLFINDLVAFSKRKDIKINGWKGLGSYRVAYARGWKIYENNVKDVDRLEILDGVEALFKFLSADRTDLVLASRLLGKKIINDLELKGIRVVEPPLISKKMYFYVNKKHEKLASQLADSLREMKKDGTYRQIYETVMKSNQ